MSRDNDNGNSKMILLVGAGIAAIVLLIFSLIAVRIKTVRGNEVGVKETWSEGVVAEPLFPSTYVLFPGWSQTIYTYDMGSQVFEMNDQAPAPDPKAKTPPAVKREGSYHVQSAEGQDLGISLNLRWRLDSAKLVEYHKTIRTDPEGKLIRPLVQRVVKDEATMLKAIDAYSGAGLVKLQADIQRDLTNPNGELAKRGIIVESFVIEGIRLDDKYIGEIRARQVATQQKLRADEETKAAEAGALKAKAEAAADFNKRVVEAERDQRVAILKAEQEAKAQVLSAQASAEKVELAAKAAQKQVVLAAEADAQKVELEAKASKTRTVLAAEGEKDSGVLRAQAIEAIGKAEAEATKLKLSAFAVPGSDNYTRIKVSEQMAISFGNIKGYLPADMSVHVISENFLRSLDAMMGGPQKK